MVAPAGTVAERDVALFVTTVAAMPLKVTAAFPRFVPVMVTFPPTIPVNGVKLAIVGEVEVAKVTTRAWFSVTLVMTYGEVRRVIALPLSMMPAILKPVFGLMVIEAKPPKLTHWVSGVTVPLPLVSDAVTAHMGVHFA